MKRGKRGRNRKSSPKLSLNLPDLDQAKPAVLNSLRRRNFRLDPSVMGVISQDRTSGWRGMPLSSRSTPPAPYILSRTLRYR